MVYICGPMGHPVKFADWAAPSTVAARRAGFRDFVELGKPRLSGLVIFTAGIGVWMGDRSIAPLSAATFVLATACLVAAANALNCWIEVEIDALMERTRDRPLPAGRMESRLALVFGIALAALSLMVLAVVSNPLTVTLGAAALISYVLVYTPLKRVTPWALPVGAVPGALPPLMGWTAATGRVSTEGMLLFAILFCWQLPHFLAISLNLKEDFRRGGIRVLSLVAGDRVTRYCLFASTLLLTLVSVAAQPLGVAGTAYTVVAAALSVISIALALPGLRRNVARDWSRRVFRFTLIHLPILITALVLGAR